MAEKYIAGSPQWLAALHAFSTAARPQMELSRDLVFCEVYTKVPASIPSVQGTIAFTVRFRHDSLEVGFELKEAEHPNFKLKVEYAALLPMARLIVNGEPEKQAELQRIFEDAVRTGRASFEGEPPPEIMALPVHDQLARITTT